MTVSNSNSLRARVRSMFPQKAASVLANCGGFNRRGERFAGNLLRTDLSSADYEAICHSLIMANGVRKTTSGSRNGMAVQAAIDTGRLPRHRALKVLDIGASFGIDAMSTYELLRSQVEVEQYTIGDLYPEVLYNPKRGLICDPDGKLLQSRMGSGFVSTYFSYNFAFQRFTNAFKRAHAAFVRRTYDTSETEAWVRIPLVHHALRVNQPGSPFGLQRMNVFDPIPGRYDLIICMHLLVARYFTSQQLESGIANLKNALSLGGALIVGAIEDFQVIVRHAEAEYDIQTGLNAVQEAVAR
jgi:hypothetical protein